MNRPKHIPEKEWKYALERAERARKWHQMMARCEAGPTDQNFQDPVWQWENEVRGRFSGVVGGNLKT